MTHLFTEKYETYTPEAAELNKAASRLLLPLIKKLSDDGVSLRDVESVLHSVVSGSVAMAIIRRNKNKV